MRTAEQVDAEIMREYVAYLAYDLAGDPHEVAEHEKAMNRALEERIHLPLQPRLPSDRDGHTTPRPV